MTAAHTSEFASLVDALSSEDLPHLKGMGRRERRAAETRLRLFRCALQLFAARGFPNVTVEDITETADVGKGTFFNYFRSKEHVLGVMAEIQLGKIREALEQAKAGRRSVESVLRHLLERVAEEPGRSPDLARAFISSFLASEFIRKQIDRSMLEGRRMIGEIVGIGQKQGEINPKLKKEQVALLFQESGLGTLLLWSLHGEPGLQTSFDTTFQHFWRAIAFSD
jgi:TetR/AcrR family transcriptional regulator, cholesterol catabolism regulator